MKNPLTHIYFPSFKAIIYGIFALTYISLSAQQNKQLNNNSGYNSNVGWTIKDPFKSEVFIENNGQFNKPNGQEIKNVKYAINNAELKVYFTPTGLSYHILNSEINPKYIKEIEEIKEEIEHSIEKNKNPDDYLKKYFIDKSAYVNIEWIGCNPNASIIVSDKVYDNYSYSVKNQNGEYQSIIANAYKKLTYKNIYPNIDAEYYFPENNEKLGVEYNIVVHPGGDLSKVKMKYNGMQNISLDANGNIVVTITGGNITDHAPGFSYIGNKGNEIKAKYILQDQTVSFNVPNYDKSQQLVIDPFTSIWSVSPGFNTTNNGYTIRIDYNKNVYVMGGLKPSYQVKKFNSAGVLQWTAATPSGNLGAYGDMVVLRGGKAIVGHGIGNGPQAFILNTTNGAITNRNCPGGVNEFGWRLSYNQAVNNGVMWAGGGSNNGSHLIKTDTNLNAATIHNVWNSTTGSRNTEDIVYLAQDPASNFVYITNASNSNNNGVTGSTSAPKFCKSAVGTPGTAIWQVNEPTLMMELGQGSYIATSNPDPSTGLNGMVVCGNSIYTYDGNKIRNYNSLTGAITNTASSGGTFDKYSGIAVDNCCRLYVGVNGVVKRYSSSLVFDQSIIVTGDVYDLQLDPLDDKILYVTGKGFVQKLEFKTCPTCINISSTNIVGCNLGTASVTVTDPSGTAPYTYSWSPGGQTTQTLTGLNTGTYIVTVTDAAAPCPLTWQDTVVITGTFVPCGPTVTATGGTICAGGGSCVNLNATGGGTAGPYTYTWKPLTGLTTSTGATVSACPLSTTIYTVTIKDAAGDSSKATAVVNITPIPTVTVNSPTICAGVTTTLTASGANTYSWSPAIGLSSTTNTNVTVTPQSNTSYTVTGSTNGCTNTAVSNIVVTPNPTITVTSSTICANTTATLIVSGATTYTWSGGVSPTTGSVVTASPNATTVYTVTGNNGSCNSLPVTATITVGTAISITVPSVAICTGATATLTASGAVTYTWLPNNVTGTTFTDSPTANTTYTVIGINGNCTGTTTTNIIVNTIPTVSVTDAIVCAGTSTVLTASGATTYIWSSNATTNTISVSPTINPTTYTVTGSVNGCTNIAVSTVTVIPSPTITVTSSTICTNGTATLIANGAISYTWSAGVTPINGTTVTASPISTTVYTVTGSNGICTSSVTSTVNVTPVIVINVPPAMVCLGSTATLTASGATTYTWLPMNTNGTSTNVTPTITTTYSVIGASGSCTGSTTVNVIVNAIPTVSVTDATVCAGTPALLNASGATSYTWSNGVTTSTAVVSPTINPTTYTVIGSVNGCTNTAISTVSVQPTPTITVIRDTTIIKGTSTPLSVVGSGTSYTWSPSLGLSCTTCTNPIASPIVTTQYCVNTALGSCPTSSCITVNVEIVCYSNADYTTPNAFTPNGDDANDEFCLQGWEDCTVSFYIAIFDRWGEKVFSSEDPGFCWDGTYLGLPLNTAVFVYYIKAEILKVGTITRKGNITLIR